MPDLSDLDLNHQEPSAQDDEDDEDYLTFDRHQDPLDFYDAYFDDDDNSSQDEDDDDDLDDEDEDSHSHSHATPFRMPIPHRPSSSSSLLHQPGHAHGQFALPASSPSLTQSFHLNAFAPPFYNRPPTPLPPSPSLTSLLRPTFSSNGTSRPTTPDSSDDVDADTNNDTEAVVAKSARIATTVPRASPKVPTYEYYGFVLYLASSLAFLIYLLWSYLPSPFLHQLGIYYYPNRWWSLAIPAYLVMSIVYVYVALAAYNTGYLTLPMKSIENIVDEAANIAVIDGKGRRRGKGSEKINPNSVTWVTMGGSGGGGSGSGSGGGGGGGGGGGCSGKTSLNVAWEGIWSEGTDAVMDIPVGGVCEVLYGNGNGNGNGRIEDDGHDSQEIEQLEDIVYTGPATVHEKYH